jgi:hypothetical protein
MMHQMHRFEVPPTLLLTVLTLHITLTHLLNLPTVSGENDCYVVSSSHRTFFSTDASLPTPLNREDLGANYGRPVSTQGPRSNHSRGSHAASLQRSASVPHPQDPFPPPASSADDFHNFPAVSHR